MDWRGVDDDGVYLAVGGAGQRMILICWLNRQRCNKCVVYKAGKEPLFISDSELRRGRQMRSRIQLWFQVLLLHRDLISLSATASPLIV